MILWHATDPSTTISSPIRAQLPHTITPITKPKLWLDIPHDPLHLCDDHHMCLNPRSTCISLWRCFHHFWSFTTPSQKVYFSSILPIKTNQWTQTSQTHFRDYNVLLHFMQFLATQNPFSKLKWKIKTSFNNYKLLMLFSLFHPWANLNAISMFKTPMNSPNSIH